MTFPVHKCKSCSSSDVIALDAGIRVRSPELDGLMKAVTLHVPNVVICLDCGLMQTNLAPAELALIGNLRVVGANPGNVRN